jgi:transcription initiation factor IIF auxiliary subunit
MNFDKLSEELDALDREIRSLTKESSYDGRVIFKHNVLSQRKDEEGNTWYTVKLFLEPQRGYSLDKVEKVVYVLHRETFDPNVIAVADKSTGFALQMEVWGDFHVMAVVVYDSKKPDISYLIQYLPVGTGNAKVQ